jgi:3-oxoacyl-[acyl-carrier protein] reductase
MLYDFKDYNVIVTGGTRGIGKAVAELFLTAGATVTATYFGNEETANSFKAEWAESGRLETVKFDVADYSMVEDFFNDFNKKHDSLEVLVNNAGIRRDSVVGMMNPEDWQAVIQTNLTGTYNMSKFALMKMMQNRFGRIISVTSPSGRLGFAGQANYAAAKAGQVAFSKSLCKEAGKRKITVNCVSPGFIDTDLIADLPEDLKKEYKAQVPLKRFGSPEEVASAVGFLASRESAYVNGTVLEVTGGL